MFGSGSFVRAGIAESLRHEKSIFSARIPEQHPSIILGNHFPDEKLVQLLRVGISTGLCRTLPPVSFTREQLEGSVDLCSLQFRVLRAYSPPWISRSIKDFERTRLMRIPSSLFKAAQSQDTSILSKQCCFLESFFLICRQIMMYWSPGRKNK